MYHASRDRTVPLEGDELWGAEEGDEELIGVVREGYGGDCASREQGYREDE